MSLLACIFSGSVLLISVAFAEAIVEWLIVLIAPPHAADRVR